MVFAKDHVLGQEHKHKCCAAEAEEEGDVDVLKPNKTNDEVANVGSRVGYGPVEVAAG